MLDAIALAPADPALPVAAARDRALASAVAAQIAARLAGGAAPVTSRPTLATAGGLTFLAPTLVSLPPVACARPSWAGVHPLFGYEAPFPFATIVGVSAAQADALAAGADVVHRIGPEPC